MSNIPPIVTTFTGRRFNLEEPRMSMIVIEDIAHALSNLCRYTGHCREFYSVAQHSVLVARNLPPAAALAGLLHDASEAYLGDVSTPLKQLLPAYKRLEFGVTSVIEMRFAFNQSEDHSKLVKSADLRAMATEKRDLMYPAPAGEEWSVLDGHPPFVDEIYPWEPERAERIFLETFEALA